MFIIMFNNTFIEMSLHAKAEFPTAFPLLAALIPEEPSIQCYFAFSGRQNNQSVT